MHSWTRGWVVAAALVAVLLAGVTLPSTSLAEELRVHCEILADARGS
jgi:hypothetical protein